LANQATTMDARWQTDEGMDVFLVFLKGKEKKMMRLKGGYGYWQDRLFTHPFAVRRRVVRKSLK